MRTNFFANFARDSVQSLHFADAVLHGMATRTMGIAPLDPGPRMAWDSSSVPAPSVVLFASIMVSMNDFD